MNHLFKILLGLVGLIGLGYGLDLLGQLVFHFMSWSEPPSHFFYFLVGFFSGLVLIVFLSWAHLVGDRLASFFRKMVNFF